MFLLIFKFYTFLIIGKQKSCMKPYQAQPENKSRSDRNQNEEKYIFILGRHKIRSSKPLF